MKKKKQHYENKKSVKYHRGWLDNWMDFLNLIEKNELEVKR